MQGMYLGLTADGKDVLLKPKTKGSFKIVPVTDDDTLISKKEYFAKFERGLQSIKERKGKKMTIEQVNAILEI
jgi:hypothetical protein